MTTKYIARLDGKIIGKRTSQNRTYSHAIVAQYVEEAIRAYAYGYKADAQDRKNFEYFSRIVAEGVNHEHVKVRPWRAEPDMKVLNDAKANVEGGFDAYEARLRDAAIAAFLARKAKGDFEPAVVGWAGRRDLADKAARQLTGNGGWGPYQRKLVAIVEAEVA